MQGMTSQINIKHIIAETQDRGGCAVSMTRTLLMHWFKVSSLIRSPSIVIIRIVMVDG